ncbi:huntingtin interacting protein-related [Schistosoma mansoni]|uniref:huntingtin interacting protein-related n=1 Tax=Schistosoma mansoni TaxID=6183 RepID=UPI0001A62ED9|nr:huntingtin interacting protein-related [Schistosoma mansoni]|eukprot:XP_018651027.1 huntingtin interacting protein-related [Schistosoma mansoni]
MNWNPFLDNSIQLNNHVLSSYQTHVADEKHEVLIEVELLKSEIERLKAEHHEQSFSLLNRIRILEDEIKELVQYKSNHEEQQVNYETKLTEKVCQAQMFEEKFLKLKEVYTKLREEHVVLLKNNLRHHQTSSSLGEVESSSTPGNQLEESVDQCLKLQYQLNAYESKFESINTQLAVELSLIKQKSSLNEEKLSESQQLIKDYEMKISKLTSELQILNDQINQEKLFAVKGNDTCNENTFTHIIDDKDCKNGELTVHLDKFKQMLLKNTIEQILSILQSNQTIGQSPEFIEVYIHCSPTYLLNHLSQVINDFNSFESALTDYLSDSEKDCLHNLDLIQSEFMELLNVLLQINSIDQDHINCNHDNDNYFNQIKEYLSMIHSHLKSMSIELKNLPNCLSNDNNNDDIMSSTDVIQKEMETTFEAITVAEQKFQGLIAESKKNSMNNENLQVNSLILDCCSELLLCVSDLVKQSKLIQQEFDDSPTSVEFYKPYNRWTKGLLSAAKFVGASANVMVEIADSIVCGKDVKLERLIVISQEIAASTTQLVYATRVKTTSQSEMFNKLQLTSKEVCKCTGNLIACVKKAIEAKHIEELDFSSLTLTQAKRMEVELQVKIIELETSLTNERQRLAQLRRDNYQLSAEVELINER